MDLAWSIVIVIVCGAAGGFVNVFIGDNGLHLPRIQNGMLEPGFLGTMLVGAAAALGSWGATKAITIFGASAAPLSFSTGDIANALILGFGGAKWFKSENEKDILQRAAAIAATKAPNQQAAIAIASGTPRAALTAALEMQP
jgi:hypothetical protein